MKFSISYGPGGKTAGEIRGLPGLREAAHVALALGRLRAGQDYYFMIRTNGEHLTGVSCLSFSSASAESIEASGARALAVLRQRKRMDKARWAFLQAHGGYDGPLHKLLWSEARDPALSEAYFANRFADVLARAAELGIEWPAEVAAATEAT